MKFTWISQPQNLPDGLVAIGGNLSEDLLLSNYKKGLFPWYENSPILWWSPSQRAVLKPEEIYINRSLRKLLRKNSFKILCDSNFTEVIKNCANIKRREQQGTWIVNEIIQAYVKLHELGYAHSIEVYQDTQLIGGLYGVAIGGCFFGESMFSIKSNASKIAFVFLCKLLASWQFELIDCQFNNEYLKQFGVYTISKEHFLSLLKKGLENKIIKNQTPKKWSSIPMNIPLMFQEE